MYNIARKRTKKRVLNYCGTSMASAIAGQCGSTLINTRGSALNLFLVAGNIEIADLRRKAILFKNILKIITINEKWQIARP